METRSRTARRHLVIFALASVFAADPCRADTVVGPSQLLEVTATSGVGDPGLVTVQSGGTLELAGINGPIVTVPNSLSLSGNGFDGAQGAVWASDPNGQATLSGPISLDGGGALITSAGTLNLAGRISGGTLAIGGSGTVVLSGSNSYGDTILNAGTLKLVSGGSLGQGSVQINGGTLDLNGTGQSVQTLSGAGGTIDLGSNGSLQLNGGGFGGTITGAGSISIGVSSPIGPIGG